MDLWITHGLIDKSVLLGKNRRCGRPCVHELAALVFGVFFVFILSVSFKSWRHFGVTTHGGFIWVLIMASFGYIIGRVALYCRENHAAADSMAEQYISSSSHTYQAVPASEGAQPRDQHQQANSSSTTVHDDEEYPFDEDEYGEEAVTL